MTLGFFQVLGREGCSGSCFSFLLAFRGGGSASAWRVIGHNFIQIIKFFYSIAALKRVLEEHRNVVDNLSFIYVNGDG